MDKNLQNIDDVFNRAQRGYEDEPSPAVWEKLNAALDKEDAEDYKRGFISWRRIAILLILLLSGFILYETGIIRRGSQGNGDDEAVSNPQKVNTSQPSTNRPGSDRMDKTKMVINEDKDTDEQETVNAIQSTLPTADTNTKGSIVKTQEQSYSNEINVPVNNGSVKRRDWIKKESDGNVTIEIKNAVAVKKQKQDNRNKITLLQNDSGIVYNENPTNEFLKLRKIELTPDMTVPLQRLSAISLQINERKPVNINVPSIAANISPSQNKPSSKKKFKPYWTMTAYGSNDWAQYQLDNDVPDNTGNQQDEKEEISRREKHESSFSAGVMIARQLNKHIGLKTGVIYSNTAIGISPQEMYAAKKTDGSIAYKYITSSGYGFVKPGFGLPPAIGDSIKALEAQHNLQMVSILLMVSYKFEKGKFAISPAVGVSANFIASAKVKTEVTDALNKEAVTIIGLDGMRNFYAGFIADVNLQYNLNKRWSINVLPGLKYAVSPITQKNVVKTFPYSFNMGAGITYKF